MTELQFFALGVLWVGGWSFLFFDYPAVACRLLFHAPPTPKRLRLMRKMGAVGLAILFLSALGEVLAGFFHF